MQTKKDLLQAHRLMTQRASQALMLGEPDNPELPLRRINIGLFCGILVGAVVAAGFGIWGLISPGGAQGLEKPGTVIIEEETGAQYVWCQDGHTLCPVANYTSAMLLSKGDNEPRSVSRNSLAKYPRGPLIGIPGAPDSLPDGDKLVKYPWSVCVRTVETALSGRLPIVSLVAGQKVGGTPLPKNQAIVVKAGKQNWLLWHDQRRKVPAYAVPLLTTNVAPVAAKWLNAVPAAPAFAPPPVPGRGTAVAGPQGKARVGQIFTVDSASGKAWYVLLSDGLARITAIQAQMLRLDPDSKKAYPGAAVKPISLPPAAATGAKKSAQTVSREDMQGTMPHVAEYKDSTALCSSYRDSSGKSGPVLTTGGSLPTPPKNVTGGGSGVDQLVFPPGGAALVGLLPGQGKAKAVSTYYLIAEGRRFALKSSKVAGKLGYDLSSAVAVPASVLQLIPNGPVLDPKAAAAQVSQKRAGTSSSG